MKVKTPQNVIAEKIYPMERETKDTPGEKIRESLKKQAGVPLEKDRHRPAVILKKKKKTMTRKGGGHGIHRKNRKRKLPLRGTKNFRATMGGKEN